MRRLTTPMLMAIAAGVLMLPATASAEGDLGVGTTGGTVPRIISHTPLKPISFAEAKRRQAVAKRKGKRPRGPILASTKGLAKAPSLTPDARNRTPSAEAQEVPITAGKPNGAGGKLFGFAGTYDAKKWPILNW